ncbi:MAG: hypothetical protein NTY74_08420 [Ignavibacteriae bacterium]|nr:hypothetical protein [Ignavibacteriota bacterium]
MKKSEYIRSTLECRFDEMKPSFRNNVRAFAEEYKLGDVENEIINCFETTNRKKGFLGRIKTDYTEICITKGYLFWGTFTDKAEDGIGAAEWKDMIEVREWKDSELGKLIEESGVEMFGFLFRASHRGTWYIALGNDDAGRKCTSVMKEMANKDVTLKSDN